MQTINKKILSRVYGHGRGWAFSPNDLVGDLARKQVDNALSDLVAEGTIRRVCRGMYDYPKYSDLLGQQLSPDIDQVAHAFARKFNWRIQPSGDAALNLLGLSTQVPGKYVYLSDGPSKTYSIGNTELEFKKTVLKEAGFRYRQSGLIVQALKTLGSERVAPEMIEKIRNDLDPELRSKILKDTKKVYGWIYSLIAEICREGSRG